MINWYSFLYKKNRCLPYFYLFFLCSFSNAEILVNDSVIIQEKLPKRLSEFNFFSDLPAQIPNTDVVPYELITPLFSDYTKKKRFVYVPDGNKAKYKEKSVYQFPNGSALIKTFYFLEDERRPGSKITLLETRVLLKKDDGWDAGSYVWNEEKKDAVLKIAGKAINSSWINQEGEIIKVRYKVPNKNQCKECHQSGDKLIPIGPKPRNLNKDLFYPKLGEKHNQLIFWLDKEIIDHYPDSIERVVDWENTNEGIEDRARSYLAINCGHCHSKTGNASSSGLYLDFLEERPKQLGIYKKPVAAGRGSGNMKYSIVPGKPEKSILLYRMLSLDPGVMMPESGRALNHKEGIALISSWIETMRR